MERVRGEDPGDQPRVQTEDPRPAHLGDLHQRELGRPLQPQQGSYEVLQCRE